MISFPALIGVILFFVAIGVGTAASYLNVTRSRGPKEKSFVFWVSIASWVILLSMLACAYFLKPPLLYPVMAGYFIVCPVLVYNWSTKHQLIRLVEQREAEESGAK
jgi:predicted membrane channel-forming protein YqfA (hemolysin III family)